MGHVARSCTGCTKHAAYTITRKIAEWHRCEAAHGRGCPPAGSMLTALGGSVYRGDDARWSMAYGHILTAPSPAQGVWADCGRWTVEGFCRESGHRTCAHPRPPQSRSPRVSAPDRCRGRSTGLRFGGARGRSDLRWPHRPSGLVSVLVAGHQEPREQVPGRERHAARCPRLQLAHRVPAGDLRGDRARAVRTRHLRHRGRGDVDLGRAPTVQRRKRSVPLVGYPGQRSC